MQCTERHALLHLIAIGGTTAPRRALLQQSGSARAVVDAGPSVWRAAGLDARLWMPGAREPGRGRYIAELETEAARAGLAEALVITTPTAAMAEAYAACDLVLQLSRKPEAFGRTVIEALSVGRPVLGWAHGGVGELLDELQPEGAVPPFDLAALGARAQALIAQGARKLVTMPYTLHRMQQATLAIYEQLVHD